VKSIDLLIGKNGSCKSSVMQLLGLPRSTLHEVYPLGEMSSVDGTRHTLCTWFALYHITDNQFAVEGYYPNLLSFIEHRDDFSQEYSAAFYYDMNKQCVLDAPVWLQTVAQDSGKREQPLFFVFSETSAAVEWYKGQYRAPRRDYSGKVFCTREYAEHSGFQAITEYLFAAYHPNCASLSSQLGCRPGATITLDVRRSSKGNLANDGSQISSSAREENGEKNAGKIIYNTDMELADVPGMTILELSQPPSKFTTKQALQLIYLEELVCAFIMARTMDRKPTEYIPYSDQDTYMGRKQYLLDRLYEFSPDTASQAKKCIEGIDAIPECFFDENRANIPVFEMKENFLSPLMAALDEDLRNEQEITHRYYLNITFSGFSTGEVQFLDLFSSLHSTIQASQHSAGDTCVLLLDEPDCRFHPEWSRRLISSLNSLLQTEPFNQYSYQVVISTHSPLLVSDVPKESIHCFVRDLDTNEVSIKSSRYGFMSNLMDLLTDSFYTDSVFGAYSENYVNQIINEIEALEKEQALDAAKKREKIADLRHRLSVIDDDMIRSSIVRRIQRMEMRIR
jgi:hypothetical protein